MKKVFFFFPSTFLSLLFSCGNVFSQPAPPNFAPANGGDIHEIRELWVVNYMPYVWGALTVIAVLLIVGGLVWWFIYFLKSRRPTLTLYQIVMEQLRQCGTLIVEGNAKLFSGEVSGIVRGYLERRFSVPSTHQTTEEFIRSATQHANSELEPHLPQLKDFLNYCDMAKFAKSELSVELMQLMLDSAKKFVESTKPEETPKPDAEVNS